MLTNTAPKGFDGYTVEINPENLNGLEDDLEQINRRASEARTVSAAIWERYLDPETTAEEIARAKRYDYQAAQWEAMAAPIERYLKTVWTWLDSLDG